MPDTLATLFPCLSFRVIPLFGRLSVHSCISWTLSQALTDQIRFLELCIFENGKKYNLDKLYLFRFRGLEWFSIKNQRRIYVWCLLNPIARRLRHPPSTYRSIHGIYYPPVCCALRLSLFRCCIVARKFRIGFYGWVSWLALKPWRVSEAVSQFIVMSV